VAKIGEFFNETIESLLEMAKGNYQDTENLREGIVIRPFIVTFSETLRGRLSFKVLNNSFLVENEE